MTTTERKQILDWIEMNRFDYKYQGFWEEAVNVTNLTAFIESISTETQLDHIEIEIDKVQRAFMNHAHGMPAQSIGYIDGLKKAKQLINKI